MNLRQKRKQFKKLAYLFRTVDGFGQLMPSLILSPLSYLATRLGWCERFTVEEGQLRQRWQRLTPKGKAIARRLLK
jgi:hypothetical protein